MGLRDGTGLGKLVLSAVEPFFWGALHLVLMQGLSFLLGTHQLGQSGLQKSFLRLFGFDITNGRS